MEVFCLTAQKKSPVKKFLGWFCLVLTILTLVLCCGSGNIFLFIAAIVLGFLSWFLILKSDIEYECSYFDGEFRFARIRSKSSRKALKQYAVDDVIQIAPAGDRSVYKYENDKNVKVYDYTSKKPGTPYYDMIIKTTDGNLLYKVELDDAYLNAVCIKYSYKVIRRKESAQ